MTLSTRSSGQMLLIAAILICVLIGVSIPLVMYLNHIATRTVTVTQQRERARATAREGLAYASHVLSSTAAWKTALRGECPASFKDTTGNPRRFMGSAELEYTLSCFTPESSGTVGLHVSSFAGGKEASPDPLIRMEAILARRSLGAMGQESEGSQKSAAVQLREVPHVEGKWETHWGSIVCYASDPWKIHGEMDRYQFPRKYSQGPIEGVDHERGATQEDTDDREYFGRVSLGFAAILDERLYKTQAETSSLIPPPTAKSSGRVIQAQPKNSGYFFLDQDIALFSGKNMSLYQIAQSSAVLFIDGDARFENMALDLKEGAILVKGNLTLASQTQGQGIYFNDIRVPAKAAEEYPYDPLSGQFPCRNEAGRTCAQSITVHIRGFLYVQGDLILEEPLNGESLWVLDGALRVDGRLKIPAKTHLIVYYDDHIGDAIQVANSGVFAISVKER
jgi:hypothetical protein